MVSFILAFAALLTGFAQPPTRVYGPATNDSALTIQENSPGQFSYFSLCPFGPEVAFGINVTKSYCGFARWSFSNANLPQGSTIAQVRFRFRAYQHGFFSTHSTFTLFDVKLPINGDYLVKYQALNNSNKIFDRQTHTENGSEEWFDTTVTSGKLIEAIQNALTSGRNYVTLGFKRNPEYGADGYWDLQTTPNGCESSLLLTVNFHPRNTTFSLRTIWTAQALEQ